MHEIIAENWWVFALRGLGSIVFGSLVWLYPELTLFIFLNLFIANSFFGAVLMMLLTVRALLKKSHWQIFLVLALIEAAAGCISLAFPGIVTVGLFALFAPVAIVVGLLLVVIAFQLKPKSGEKIYLIIGGCLSAVLGIALLADQFWGFKWTNNLIAVQSFVFGITLITTALILRFAKP